MSILSKNKTKLWPGSVPTEDRNLVDDATLAEQLAANTPDRIQSVVEPIMTWYSAPSNTGNGTAILVCPGGAYQFLSGQKEGSEIAEWLNSLGISAAVLEYRVPRRHSDTFHIPPLQDARRGMRILRSRAATLGVQADRIGIMGFSAGGHVAILTGNQAADPVYPPIDAIDRESARPDFVVSIYPAYLGNEQTIEPLSSLVKVSEDTPPTFLAVTQDDALRDVNAAHYYVELKRHHVPAELHIYTRGGHGYGLRDTGHPVSSWNGRCEDWLRDQGWV